MTYTIYGALGSPYSMKMRAILRYRRLPHIWKQLAPGDEGVFEKVKAPVIPVLEYPDGSWKNDSTPLIFDLEKHHSERSIVPEDEGLAFLAYLLEDFADEWGTKAMFHYRWYRERDQRQMSEWLLFDRLRGEGRDTILRAAQQFRERQVGRMALVGCTAENAPVIENSAKRILQLFEEQVTEQGYLFGSRPSLADFAWFGQLSQLANDPTPSDLMRADYPFTWRWLANVDDLSGVAGRWQSAESALAPAVRGLLELCGEIYLPFLEANARALEEGREQFSLSLPDGQYSQAAFKYQGKCLRDLRAAWAALAPDSRAAIEPVLRDCNCLALL